MTEYYPNGQKKAETLPDGTVHKWYENGQLRVEDLPDGTYREWYENGLLLYEELPRHESENVKQEQNSTYAIADMQNAKDVHNIGNDDVLIDGIPINEYIAQVAREVQRQEIEALKQGIKTAVQVIQATAQALESLVND